MKSFILLITLILIHSFVFSQNKKSMTLLQGTSGISITGITNSSHTLAQNLFNASPKKKTLAYDFRFLRYIKKNIALEYGLQFRRMTVAWNHMDSLLNSIATVTTNVSPSSTSRTDYLYFPIGIRLRLPIKKIALAGSFGFDPYIITKNEIENRTDVTYSKLKNHIVNPMNRLGYGFYLETSFSFVVKNKIPMVLYYSFISNKSSIFDSSAGTIQSKFQSFGFGYYFSPYKSLF